MSKETVIDVDYIPIESPKNKDISINIDPTASAIDALKDVSMEYIRCHNDYKKCKEEQITERARIKAQYNLLREDLIRKHEEIMAVITVKHKAMMGQLEHNNNLETMMLNNIQKQIDMAMSVGDTELVKYFLNCQMSLVNNFHEMTSDLISSNTTSSDKMLDWNPNGETKLLN